MVEADLDKSGKRIILRAGYDPRVVQLIRSVPGSSWRKVDRVWAVPADLPTGRLLRRLLGAELTLSPRLHEWATREGGKQRNLRAISTSSDVPLDQLKISRTLPALAESLWAHQRADTLFMASTDCINANEQGTGKTRAALAAAYEAGLGERPHIVIAPVVSIEATWAVELEEWLHDGVILASEDAKERKAYVAEAERLAKEGKPFWLIVNKEMIRFRNSDDGLVLVFPELFDIKWGTVTIDEFHKAGLSNPKTMGARAFRLLRAERRWAMSGTPMGGKPLRLWGALHWLDPKAFSSKDTWIRSWLHVEKNPWTGFEKVGDVREDVEEEFYSSIAPYVVRRLKADVFPELPPKERQDVWCRMTPAQRRQYDQFAMEAEIRIGEHHLTASGILAEYARLKVFATATCEVEGTVKFDKRAGVYREHLRLKATQDSGKLLRLLQTLEECGVETDEDELGALVGSQDRSVVMAATTFLRKAGYRVATMMGGHQLDGSVREIVQEFQAGGPKNPQIIVMTVQKGGTSLTLDRADSVHILDESWTPDDQEQFEDRAHRGSRMHLVRCFYYLSFGTIDEYIREVTDRKRGVNYNILDLRRKGLRAVGDKSR
jgi:SNF2 family DNA or RNA helicase